MRALSDEVYVTIRRMAARILLIPLWMFLAGLGGSFLLKWAPGAMVDGRELDPRFSAAAVAAIRAERREQASGNTASYTAGTLWRAAQGDLGVSWSLGLPVRDLVEGRIVSTAQMVGGGLTLAWLVSMALAGAWLATGWQWLDRLAMVGGSVILAVPSAVIGVVFLEWRLPVALGLGLVLFPRLYSYLHHALADASRRPHVLLAIAKGLKRRDRAFRHILPHALPTLLPVAGLSVSLALGAAVPLEVLSDRPGLGQLAWQAAISRDLPVLVALTWVIALITLLANAAGDIGAEWAACRLSGRRS